MKGIEGENDFSGKRYVWLKDPHVAFVKGWVVEELEGGRLLVQCDDGSVSKRRLMREKRAALLTPSSSNARSIAKVWIKSTLPSSTRLTTWPS